MRSKVTACRAQRHACCKAWIWGRLQKISQKHNIFKDSQMEVQPGLVQELVVKLSHREKGLVATIQDFVLFGFGLSYIFRVVSSLQSLFLQSQCFHLLICSSSLLFLPLFASQVFSVFLSCFLCFCPPRLLLHPHSPMVLVLFSLLFSAIHAVHVSWFFYQVHALSFLCDI